MMGLEFRSNRINVWKPNKVEATPERIAAPNGDIYVSRRDQGDVLLLDDANGVIYRIAYTGGKAAAATPPKAPAGPMEQQVNKGNKLPLANKRPETEAKGQLSVSSSSFANNAMMDQRYTEYADGVSPALSWKAVAGAKSYAVIMEDPDAKPVAPFVHWVMWNIPATITSVTEGVQEQPRLSDPDGVLQGRTTRGAPGYYGPKPPVGEAAHRYHFQVYALDKMLDVPFGADRDQVLQAMKGHVLAKGEIVGKYGQKQQPQK